VWWKLHDPNFNRFWLIHPCDGRTDRRTDGRNCDSICALSIYAVARKNSLNDRLQASGATKRWTKTVTYNVLKLATLVWYSSMGVKVDGTYYCDLLLSQQLLPATRHVHSEFEFFQKTVLQHTGHAVLSDINISQGSVATPLRYVGPSGLQIY